MSNQYKLTPEIVGFIISQKKANPVLSCRKMVSLVNENFSLKVSKSMINKIMKENKLSSPVGRRRLKEPPPVVNITSKKEDPVSQINEFSGFITNGGCFLLKIADIKLSLSLNLAKSLSIYFPQISVGKLQKYIEFFIYGAFFEDKSGLSIIIGENLTLIELSQVAQVLIQAPIQEINEVLNKSGVIDYNFKDVNDLYKRSLQRLNLYAQANFFPFSTQLLDFSAMQARFYSLFAKVKKNNDILEIFFFYPQGFSWGNDIIWRDDFLYVANKINEDKIFTSKNEQIWVHNSPQNLEVESAYF